MPYFFGMWNGSVSGKWLRAANKVSKKHDADVVAYTEPNGRERGWMSCFNRGAPFDKETARAVIRDLEAAGLWDCGPTQEGLA